MDKWRVIIDGKHPATFNMAADAFLLESAESEKCSPVLRLYGWRRPSITIGYHQSLQRALDSSKVGTTPVVRRITGGRALLHDDGEITYAMAGNFGRYPQIGLSLHESYHLISRAIVSFYNMRGVPAQISHRDQPVSLSQKNSIQKGCFAAVSHYEIIVDGDKIAAGSQRRTTTSFMQHGAIKIAVPENHPAILDAPQHVNNNYMEGVASDMEGLTGTLIRAFEDVFEVELEISPFSRPETAAIEAIEPRFENLNSLK